MSENLRGEIFGLMNFDDQTPMNDTVKTFRIFTISDKIAILTSCSSANRKNFEKMKTNWSIYDWLGYITADTEIGLLVPT